MDLALINKMFTTSIMASGKKGSSLSGLISKKSWKSKMVKKILGII